VLFGFRMTLGRWDPDGAAKATTIFATEPVEGGVGLPDGRVLIAVLDGTVRLWDVNQDRELHAFPCGHAVLCLAVAPDGRHFASGGHGNVARMWRLPGVK